MFLYG
jgi:hypothetical protein